MHAMSNIKIKIGNTATIVEMNNVSWCYYAKTYAVDHINGRMYAITIKGCIAIPKWTSLTPFPVEMSLAGSHQTQTTMWDSTVSTALPTSESISYNNTTMSWPRT